MASIGSAWTFKPHNASRQPQRRSSWHAPPSAARQVRLTLRVSIGASAEVVAELEGWGFKGDGAGERV